MNPKPLVLVALTTTCVESIPRAWLMRFRISEMKGESFGSCAMMVTSLLATLSPLALSNSLVFFNKTRLETPLYSGSPGGNKVPMSPRSAAPHKASIMAWIATSASLQPIALFGKGHRRLPKPDFVQRPMDGCPTQYQPLILLLPFSCDDTCQRQILTRGYLHISIRALIKLYHISHEFLISS